VIGIPHEIKGESAVAFSILKEKADLNKETVRSELIQLVRGRLAKFAAPEKIYFVTGLPKTRSGKIMRRILRKISAGQIDEIGDVSTLADPSVVQLIIQKGCSEFLTPV
jgi:acetyl-CoA synthetase